MDLEIAKFAIKKMLGILYEKDKFLLKRNNDLTERSTTHRMGILSYVEVYYTEGD